VTVTHGPMVIESVPMAPEGFDDICAQARAAIGAGDYKTGRTLYVKATGLMPDSPDAHYGLATCYYLLSDFDTALKHFKEVTRLDPLRATAFINLGALYNRLGQQDEAVVTLRKGLQLDPRRAEGYYNLGIAYRQKGLADLAIQAYREATRLNPRMADAFLNLGNLLLEAERFPEAITAYQHALSVRPNFEKALQGLHSAQQGLAAATPPAQHAATGHSHPEESSREAYVGAAHGFANVVERAEAMDHLRDACHKQEEWCRELSRVIEQELGPAIRDLSRSLVGTPAVGELDIHVQTYETSLVSLRAARRNMDEGFQKIRDLGSRFTAAAHAAGEPVM